MIDKDIVRGTMKGARFAEHQLHIDTRQLFSDYGLEMIKEITKLQLADAFLHDTPPETMTEKACKSVLDILSHAVEKHVIKSLADLLPPDTPTELKAAKLAVIIKEVMLGDSSEQKPE